MAGLAFNSGGTGQPFGEWIIASTANPFICPSGLAWRAVRLVEQFTSTTQNTSTCKPALHLHAYNFLRKSPLADDSQVLEKLRHLNCLLQCERQAFENRYLPSIGIEVEVTSAYLPVFLGDCDICELTPIAQDLEYMGIHVEYINTGLSELKLPPTTSVNVQWHMLVELIRLGVIPRNEDGDDFDFASLHINFGISADIDERAIHFMTACMISDILTYAFVPPFRVAERIGFIKGDVCTDEYEGIDIKKSGRARIHHKLEFRTPCVVGTKTYRLLRETQQLAVMIFSDTYYLQHMREEFHQDVRRLREKYHLAPRLPQREPHKAAQAIKYSYYMKIINDHSFCDEIAEEMAQLIERDTSFDVHAREQLRLTIQERLASVNTSNTPEGTNWLNAANLLSKATLVDDARAIMAYYSKQIGHHINERSVRAAA